MSGYKGKESLNIDDYVDIDDTDEGTTLLVYTL